MFSKKKCFKNKFSNPFQSVSYNSMVVTKQICFSPTFLKSWVHISDNIARLVEGLQCNYRAYRHGDFPLSNKYLDVNI